VPWEWRLHPRRCRLPGRARKSDGGISALVPCARGPPVVLPSTAFSCARSPAQRSSCIPIGGPPFPSRFAARLHSQFDSSAGRLRAKRTAGFADCEQPRAGRSAVLLNLASLWLTLLATSYQRRAKGSWTCINLAQREKQNKYGSCIVHA